MEPEVVFSLCQIITWSLLGEAPIKIKETDYLKVFKEMEDQCILPLVLPIIGKLNLSFELEEKTRTKIIEILGYNVQISYQEKKVVELLTKNSISSVIIKGTAAAQYFPKPELRVRGDVDVLVGEEDYSAAFAILTNNGYIAGEAFLPGKRHIEFSKNGIEIELHRHSYYAPEIMKNGMQNRVFRGVPMFDDLENGFLILNHIRFHITGGIGLRHILDWIMFVENKCDDIFWESRMKPIVEQYHLLELAKSIALIGKRKFNMCQKATWCDSGDVKSSDELFEYLIKSGNFYRKNSETSRQVMAFLSNTKKRNDYRESLKQRVCSSQELDKKGAIKSRLVEIHGLFLCSIDYLQENDWSFVKAIKDIVYSLKLRNLWKKLNL